MSYEINRYASQYMIAKRKKYIMGYKWQPVSVKDMLIFFGILMQYMLYPQTGRRMRDAWNDPTRNSWTTSMSKARYLQIVSMLHFNNNEDEEGMATDALHKVRPLLNIVKKTVGRYAQHGSELSFDEATMACFSRYGRKLISFNPMKPTGKFHFKLYMLCCANTNWTLKLRVHTKDGSDDGTPSEPNDSFEEKMMNNPRIPENMVDDMIERMAKNFEPRRMLTMALIGGIVVNAIIGLILAAFIKKEETPVDAAV